MNGMRTGANASSIVPILCTENSIPGGDCWGHAVFLVGGKCYPNVPHGAFVYTGRGRLEKISDLGQGGMYGHRAYLKDGDRIHCYEIRANPLSLLERCKDLAKELSSERSLELLPAELREAIVEPRRRSKRLLSKRRPPFQ